MDGTQATTDVSATSVGVSNDLYRHLQDKGCTHLRIRDLPGSYVFHGFRVSDPVIESSDTFQGTEIWWELVGDGKLQQTLFGPRTAYRLVSIEFKRTEEA